MQKRYSWVTLLAGVAVSVAFASANSRASLAEPRVAAEIFQPGVLSSPNRHEWSFAFFDGESRMIMQRSPEGDLSYTSWSLYETRRNGLSWTEPTPIGTLNAPTGKNWSDGDPAISRNGRTMVFSSNRTGNDDLYVTRRSSAGWAAPQRLPEPINSSAGEYLPWLDAKGNLYFETDRRLGKERFDIYMAPREGSSWGAPKPVPNLSTDEAAESSPSISHDGRLMLSIRKPGDIMLSEWKRGTWTSPRKLDVGLEGAMKFRPYLSKDGHWLYFTAMPQGQTDLYRIAAEAVLDR
jgi:hypothetical protein